MNLLIKWVLLSLVIMLIAWIVPGITVSGILGAMFAVIVISLVNLLIRPVVTFISLPLNVLTLGIFSLVVNALLFLLVAKLSPGLTIEGFWSGLAGAFILSLLAPAVDKINIGKKSD